MSNIPFKSLRIGAEEINQFPVKYDKTRLSGSNKTTYILHKKGICMPGKKDKFKINPGSKPNYNNDLNQNTNNRSFQINHKSNSKSPIKNKYSSRNQDHFTYLEFAPNDDETLEIAINSCYRQIFGNFHAMESERPIESERRLRNGDITIKEFIRQITKSQFYISNYFEKLNQEKCIILNIKHILGRPILNQNEIIKNIIIINRYGFSDHINSLIDSDEYYENFGEHTVPYMRGWNSPQGLKTSTFTKSMAIQKHFACSDNIQRE